jgi:transposase-like protein
MASNRATPAPFKADVLDIFATHYREYGPTLASEVLEEDHGLSVNRETLRRWLHGAHLYVPRRVPRQHRKRRERRRRLGELLQMDGSIHGWLGDGKSQTCLMVAVDDATGRTLAHMGAQETTRDAYLLLLGWIRRYGVPEAIYVDRRSLYAVTDREATAKERGEGTGPVTDFSRACWRLGIRIALANSPEAKGRVERKNGVLQDRFVKFLQRRGIDDIAGSNAALDGFLENLNARQAKAPACEVDAHRQRPPDDLLNDIFCWEEERSVSRDWTVTYQGHSYQIERQAGAPIPGRNRVTVRRRFDDTVGIIWQGKELDCTLDGVALKPKELPAPHGGQGQAPRPRTTGEPGWNRYA